MAKPGLKTQTQNYTDYQMNILDFHQSLIQNYKAYIQSFIHIKDKRLEEFVNSELENKRLWPEPLVQFNPTFQKGRNFPQLEEELGLDPRMKSIFSGYQLHLHQEKALRLGTADKEFVVTSGTGSGKSLTYIATIFNHILKNQTKAAGCIKAVIVYPMNALINSQFEELRKFEINYLKQRSEVDEYDLYGKSPEEQLALLRETSTEAFPITYAQYTGQESAEQKEAIKENPPHILLTNYMMLELSMTRAGRDQDIRQNYLQNMEFLVFDELHTYRGRQGSDVSVLIRRIKANAQQSIRCFGTSATMVSSDDTSLAQQNKQVAEVASTIFGSVFDAEQVVTEYLERSLGDQPHNPNHLKVSLQNNIDITADEATFANHPLAIWIEENVALENKEDRLVRRKPTDIQEIASLLAKQTGLSNHQCEKAIRDLLLWANQLNNRPEVLYDRQRKRYLPFRLHQFISQTGSVYSTLGNEHDRNFVLDAGLYHGEENEKLYPLVFSRYSGHEFYCVRLNKQTSKIEPREFNDNDVPEEDEAENATEAGYLVIQHDVDEDALWDLSRIYDDLPDNWLSKNKQKLDSKIQKRLPIEVNFDKTGAYSFSDTKSHKGWFVPAPLLIDPTSGVIFGRSSEFTKLMKLGGEGRSTATTVLSFETINQLKLTVDEAKKQKLLSFTDNRQDASLQAGHFNDFVKVGQLRTGIAKAVEKYTELDYANMAERVFEVMALPEAAYAKTTNTLAAARRENEDIFKELISYRMLYDLRRSWRVVMPNLEQCGLLEINYRYLEESLEDPALIGESPLLQSMGNAERLEFLTQVLDHFRRSYALYADKLQPAKIKETEKRIREKITGPWGLDDDEHLQFPKYMRFDKLASSAKNLETETLGYRSAFGRYFRDAAKPYLHIDTINYMTEAKNLIEILVNCGWLHKDEVKDEHGQLTYVYRLRVDRILWQKNETKTVRADKVKIRSLGSNTMWPNAYFQHFYQSDALNVRQMQGREHTGQINNEERKQRESQFREGELGVLFCSPTMELGIDISDLSVVHMRNVPPSPANYAQRSGRAGRSGQAALVMTYCSNYSPHDRHYFKNNSKMVSGEVSAPKLDLINQDLLRSHLYATALSIKPIGSLDESIEEIIDIHHPDLPLQSHIQEYLELSVSEKDRIAQVFHKVAGDAYFQERFKTKRPSWFTQDWVYIQLESYGQNFNLAFNRWRKLYKTVQRQLAEASEIIKNRVYADDHKDRQEAVSNQRRAMNQRELLLNKPQTGLKNKNFSRTDQSEFGPYRYLAAEGFLPGYGFTRLPIRSFMESYAETGEFLSRPRFIALQEFGPRNTVYHNGAKYQVDTLMPMEVEMQFAKAKVSPKTGYFLMGDQYGYETDPLTNEPMQIEPGKHLKHHLLEMAETRAKQQQRITCQEEERSRKGYQLETYFAIDGAASETPRGEIKVDSDSLLNMHYLPACRIFKVNSKWRVSKEEGFAINTSTGRWKSKKEAEEEQLKEAVKTVKLYTTDTANAIYLQPVEALGLQGGRDGVITLMYAIKRGIESYFQVESREIAAEIMGDEENPNMLIYEAAEGSLGILSQLLDEPDTFAKVMAEAYRICFFANDTEVDENVSPATYDDLLSYFNQVHHQKINRNYIRGALSKLRRATVEINTNAAYDSYEAQYQSLQKQRDPNSSTEDQFLKYLYQQGLRLPDQAQPTGDKLFVQPDFMYKPNVYIFCDGTPHDKAEVQADDANKRHALKKAGYQVLVWHYRDKLSDFVAKRPDIFKKVKG